MKKTKKKIKIGNTEFKDEMAEIFVDIKMKKAINELLRQMALVETLRQICRKVYMNSVTYDLLSKTDIMIDENGKKSLYGVEVGIHEFLNEAEYLVIPDPSGISLLLDD